MNFKFYLLTILWVLVGSTAAWWDNGHLLVARIAQTKLYTKNRNQFIKANKILSVLQKKVPNLTWREKNHPFVATATFGDFFKYKGGMYQKQWHFTNIPYKTNDKKAPKLTFKKDIVTAINALSKIVKGAPGSEKSFEYKQIMGGFNKMRASAQLKKDLTVSVALRLIIHYAGDIHQPLHAVSRFDNKGRQDYGGNGVKIPQKKGADNLHAVWDSVVYEQTGNIKLPLDDGSWKLLTAASSLLSKKHKIQAAQANDIDPANWALDSYKLSKDMVYPKVVRNRQLDNIYIKKAQLAAEQQIVLAGNRLANLLGKIL